MTTFAATIMQPDGTWLHQLKFPGTVDVWLAPDMAAHIAAGCVKPGVYRVVSGDADLDKRIITRKRQPATWPYTIPLDAWACGGTCYTVAVKRPRQ